MAKYYGMVGYTVEMEDDGTGVYSPEIIERAYYGNLLRNMKRNENGPGVNDDISIQNDISIVADAYAYQNFHRIRYVTFMGVNWKVNSVEVRHPRLILSVGSVYNGPTPGFTPEAPDGSWDQESLLSAPDQHTNDVSVHSVQS